MDPTKAGEDYEEKVAKIFLPQVPVRRTKKHYIARLPNFLQYRKEAFDREDYDPESDEVVVDDQGGRIKDEGLKSLLKTDNTIRWRWSDEIDENGNRVSELEDFWIESRKLDF